MEGVTMSKEISFFYGQSERSMHWLYLDLDWIEDNFMTTEPKSFKRLLNAILKYNMEKQFLHLLFLLETKHIQLKWNSILQLQHCSINRNIKRVVVSVF